jgi:excisionase family DNA binding protein
VAADPRGEYGSSTDGWGRSGTRAHLLCMEATTDTESGLEPLLGIETLADYLGVPVTTIYDWRVAGKGPCGIRVGRHIKFAVSDVRAWLAQQREARPGRRHEGR